MSAPPSINLKIDSGTAHNFHEIGSMNLSKQPTSNYNLEAQIIVTNCASLVSSATTHIPIPYLPPSDTKSYCFNHISSGSLFSVEQAYGHNCTAVFDKNSIKIFKSTEVSIISLRSPIIQGHRNSLSKPIYLVSLPTHPPQIHKVNETINFLINSIPHFFLPWHLILSNNFKLAQSN